MEKQQLNLLLVAGQNDAAPVREALAAIVSEQFKLTWETTYEAALEAMKRQAYDAYLVNHHLGSHLALDLVRAVMQEDYQAPLIVLLPPGQDALGIAALHEGAADYLETEQLGASLLTRVVYHAIERTRTRRVSQEREALLSSLITGSIQGVLIHRDFRPLFVNQTFADIFGYAAPATILEMDSIEPLLALHERERLRHYHKARLQGQMVPADYEFQGLRQDGKVIWLDSKATAITWEGQQAVQATLFDITTRKHLEAHMLQTQKLEAIGTLAGGIAHDFNNILTSILGYTELALHDLPPNNQVQGYLLNVHVAAHRAKELVQQILTFSHKREPERKLVQLHPLIEEGLRLLRASFPSIIELRQVGAPQEDIVYANAT